MSRHASFEAIGTRWQITVDVLGDDAWAGLLAAAHRRIDAFDRTYSRFRADSLVSEMARRAGAYTLPEDGPKLFDLYEQLYRLTNGAVTPLIGQVLTDAGYDAAYSLSPKPLHAPPAWETVIARYGRTLTLRRPVLLDVGAAGKGYLVDLVAAIIEEAGVTSYVINAGGDIRHRAVDDSSLTVGLENPFDTSEVLGIVQLRNASLCASAGSKRAWQGMHHIMDPRTLRPVTDSAATWVLAADTMTADGLATALFFVPPERLQEQFSFDYAVLGAAMQMSASRGFPAELFEVSHVSR